MAVHIAAMMVNPTARFEPSSLAVKANNDTDIEVTMTPVQPSRFSGSSMKKLRNNAMRIGELRASGYTNANGAYR